MRTTGHLERIREQVEYMRSTVDIYIYIYIYIYIDISVSLTPKDVGQLKLWVSFLQKNH